MTDIPETRYANSALAGKNFVARGERVPETQYATLGEDRIAYQAFREGEVDLLFVPPSGDCIELRWDWAATSTSCCGSEPRRGSSRSIGEDREHRTPPRERLSHLGTLGRRRTGRARCNRSERNGDRWWCRWGPTAASRGGARR